MPIIVEPGDDPASRKPRGQKRRPNNRKSSCANTIVASLVDIADQVDRQIVAWLPKQPRTRAIGIGPVFTAGARVGDVAPLLLEMHADT